MIPPSRPIPTKTPGALPGEQPRDEWGHFLPPIPFPPAEQSQKEDERDRKKLIKFSDVLDVLDLAQESLTAYQSKVSPDEVIPAAVEELRSMLLFQGNPIIRQKLKPLWQQNPSAQVVMGAGAPTSVARRVGGTGFAARPVAPASREALEPPPKKKKTDSQRLRR